MERIETALDFFRRVRFSFADAFSMIDYNEYPWGFSFIWPNINIQNTNFYFITQDLTVHINDLLELLSENPNIKVLIPSSIKFQHEKFEKIKQLNLYWRKKKRVNLPFLENGSIDHYSYQSKNPNQDFKNLYNIFNEILDIPNNEKKEFERFSGGLMHLNNGKIWTYELDNGNIVSCALEITDENNPHLKSIELIGTRRKIFNQGYAQKLLQSILSEYRKDEFSIVTEENEVWGHILTKFDFELIETIYIYSYSP